MRRFAPRKSRPKRRDDACGARRPPHEWASAARSPWGTAPTAAIRPRLIFYPPPHELRVGDPLPMPESGFLPAVQAGGG
jgi:hypothetical protein